MLGLYRVFSDFKITMFSRLTIEMMIGYVICIFLIIQCSKKKPEKTVTSHGSKQLLDQSIVMNTSKKKRSKDKTLEIKNSKEDVQKSEQKKSGKSGEPKGKGSKMAKTKSKRSGKTGEKETSSKTKQSGGPSKAMDGTQNGPTPNEVGPNSENKEEAPEWIKYDDIQEKEPMEDTIDEPDNPAVHERVTRLAATELIFDPKMVAYKGNVDNEKDSDEVKEFEKELEAACNKHEARFKDMRKLEERDPNYRRPKSQESEKSIDKRAPVPPDQRIKLRPDLCVLYETKEQMTEDDEEQGEEK